MKYEPVIGLEIHVELNTATKLFCSCRNEFGGAPNSRICPVCTGMPGSLPAPNMHALKLAVRAGSAFGCRINGRTRQYRKHYFYPDLPKGYQISQHTSALAVGGAFEFELDGELRRVGIRQIHIEEDAGKLVHSADGKTLIDYNRAGIPLIEIVTEPDLHSAREARAFLEAVKICLMFAGVSECRMEQGALRCDVNVSLREPGSRVLNERVEMKNINTFAGVERAIEHETARQLDVLSRGGYINSETRRWDDEERDSCLMRTKESAPDYKFLLEPDILCYVVDKGFIESACKDLPEGELPRRARYISLGVSESDARTIAASRELSEFFEACAGLTKCCGECAKQLCGDISHLISKTGTGIFGSKLTPKGLADTAELLADGRINRVAMKKIIEKLFLDGGDACKMAREYVKIVDDEELLPQVKEVLAENARAVADLKSGKEESLKYLMGRCMRRFGGRADAEKLMELIKREIR